MSQANVEAVQRVIEEWNREGPTEMVVNLVHPDCILYPFPEWPDDSVYRGRDGWRRLMNQWQENFDGITWEIERMIDEDPRLIALVTHHATIKGAGVPLRQPLGLIISEFQNGMAMTVHFFLSWNEALEAAELAEVTLRTKSA